MGSLHKPFFHFCFREVSIGCHHTVPCLWSSIIFWHFEELPPSSGRVFVFIIGTYCISNTRCSAVAGELQPCFGVLLEMCQHRVVLRALVLTLQFPWFSVGQIFTCVRQKLYLGLGYLPSCLNILTTERKFHTDIVLNIFLPFQLQTFESWLLHTPEEPG